MSCFLLGAVYLDHGGSGLYTASHLTSTQEYLSSVLLLNPHTDHATSITIDQIREQILQSFGTNSKDHSIIFTYNTSNALHLISTIFPFGTHSELAMTMDNHNSVLGMREKLKSCGPHARYSVVRNYSDASRAFDDTTMECCCSPALLHQHDSTPHAPIEGETHPCLFVFPGESNFDGRIYDLALAARVKSYNTDQHIRATNPLSLHHHTACHRWYTLVDASKLVCTSPLDLGRHPSIDFLTVSFYKLFGFPTGLAALIIRNQTAQELWGVGSARNATQAATLTPTPSLYPSLSSLRGFFAGGTVNAVIADEDFHASRSTGRLHELLEDGTIPFTTIISIPYGLMLFKTLDPVSIHRHTHALTQHLFDWLVGERYPETGRPVCKFYGTRTASAAHEAARRFGPTLNFNFLDQHGEVIGYKTVEKIASASRIFIRVTTHNLTHTKGHETERSDNTDSLADIIFLSFFSCALFF